MAAESCIECDVAIVGAGFAGALIALELNRDANNPIKVIVLEAGAAVPANINEYLERFYTAAAKVPESPYTPEVVDKDDRPTDPSNVMAGRPTSLSLGPNNWTDPK